MEEKKKIKIRLGTAVCIAIIILLVIAIGIVYYLDLVKNKELEADNMELNKQITSLKSENENLSKEISELEKEGDNVKNKYTIENFEYYMNGQITNIDDETSLFTSENPKISFEFPRSWTISSMKDFETFEDWNVNWGIDINSPLGGVSMRILKCNNTKLENLLSFSEPNSSYSKIKEYKILNYNAYSREVMQGDADYIYEGKNIIIDSGDNQYYYIISGVSNYPNEYSEKEFSKIQKEYEPIFEKIISSMKF